MFEIMIKILCVLQFLLVIALCCYTFHNIFLDIYDERHKVLKFFYNIKGHKCRIGSIFVCEKCFMKFHVTSSLIRDAYNLDTKKDCKVLRCPYCTATYDSYDNTDIWKISK